MSSYAHLLVETRGAVTLVTLDRPEALNALSSAVLEDLIAANALFRALAAAGFGRNLTAFLTPR